MNKFEIGEIAVVFSPQDEVLHQSECIITGACCFRRWAGDGRLAGCNGEGKMYEIEALNDVYLVYPHELRKKKPPKEETTTWEAMNKKLNLNWSPNKERVE